MSERWTVGVSRKSATAKAARFLAVFHLGALAGAAGGIALGNEPARAVLLALASSAGASVGLYAGLSFGAEETPTVSVERSDVA